MNTIEKKPAINAGMRMLVALAILIVSFGIAFFIVFGSCQKAISVAGIAHFAIVGILLSLIAFGFVFARRIRTTGDKAVEFCKAIESIDVDSDDQCLDWPDGNALSPAAAKINSILLAVDSERDRVHTSEALSKAFLAATPNTIVIIDNSGKIINSVVRLGSNSHSSYAESFSVGRNIFDLQGTRIEAFRQSIAAIDTAGPTGKCHITEFSLSDEEGGLIWVEARIIRIDADRILIFCHDITIRRTSGLERARLEEKINQIQKTETFGLLAGGLAHDYNNMLTAMLGNVDLIRCNDSIDDSVRETIDDVRAAMLRASALVRRMLAYASKSAPIIEQIDINAMIKDLVRLMKRSIPDNAKLVVMPGENVPVISIDSTQLWQVVMNLIINACDALDGNNGTVRVTILGMEMTDKELVGFNSTEPLKSGWYSIIEVEDTGIGMDSRTISRIFDPFFTTKTNGRGLGLSSVISIVRSYGGGIAVRSHVGQGTTFRVLFPSSVSKTGTPVYPEDLAKRSTTSVIPTSSIQDKTQTNDLEPVVQDKQQAEPTATETTSAKDNSRITLLVVDDDSSILKLLKIILKSGGYDVVTAVDGKDGLKTYEKTPDIFSLALVDASMGIGMNGMELCAEIRKRNTKIPLVLMSAYRAKEMSGKMATSGINGFLAKPFRGNDVLDLVAKYLKSIENDSSK